MIWAERLSESKKNFKDIDYELVMYNLKNTLQALLADLDQILKEDHKSLIIKVGTLQKYPLSTLKNWTESVKVSCERKTLELFD